MKVFDWSYAAAFLERVERLNLHGLHFQHIELCERRAWMYLHKINFAQWYSRVQSGIALNEKSYKRDHSVRGLMGLAPDRIDWAQHIVYENKGTAGAVEASSNQTAFYAVLLAISTEQVWQAYIHVLSSKRKREVVLDAARLSKLWEASLRLEQLSQQADVPKVAKIPLCASCSLAIFCGYD